MLAVTWDIPWLFSLPGAVKRMWEVIVAGCQKVKTFGSAWYKDFPEPYFTVFIIFVGKGPM